KENCRGPNVLLGRAQATQRGPRRRGLSRGGLVAVADRGRRRTGVVRPRVADARAARASRSRPARRASRRLALRSDARRPEADARGRCRGVDHARNRPTTRPRDMIALLIVALVADRWW